LSAKSSVIILANSRYEVRPCETTALSSSLDLVRIAHRRCPVGCIRVRIALQPIDARGPASSLTMPSTHVVEWLSLRTAHPA
jgi:hypothetical protein